MMILSLLVNSFLRSRHRTESTSTFPKDPLPQMEAVIIHHQSPQDSLSSLLSKPRSSLFAMSAAFCASAILVKPNTKSSSSSSSSLLHHPIISSFVRGRNFLITSGGGCGNSSSSESYSVDSSLISTSSTLSIVISLILLRLMSFPSGMRITKIHHVLEFNQSPGTPAMTDHRKHFWSLFLDRLLLSYHV